MQMAGMRRTLSVTAATLLAAGLMATSAVAAPADDRKANCAAIGGVYDEGSDSSHNTASCTVTTVETITSTEQVNNIKAAKAVLRTTSTTVTYDTVYAFTNSGQGSAVTGGSVENYEEGESELVMCTPGSGYEACP